MRWVFLLLVLLCLPVVAADYTSLFENHFAACGGDDDDWTGGTCDSANGWYDGGDFGTWTWTIPAESQCDAENFTVCRYEMEWYWDSDIANQKHYPNTRSSALDNVHTLIDVSGGNIRARPEPGYSPSCTYSGNTSGMYAFNVTYNRTSQEMTYEGACGSWTYDASGSDAGNYTFLRVAVGSQTEEHRLNYSKLWVLTSEYDAKFPAPANWTLADHTGNGHNLTNINGVIWNSSGHFNFNGATNYLRFAKLDAVAIANNYTLYAEFSSTGGAGDSPLIQNAHGGSNRNALSVLSNRVRMQIYNGASYTSKAQDNTITANEIYRAVGTNDAGTVAVYVDGVAGTLTGNAYAVGTSTYGYLGHAPTNNFYLNGSLYDVRIWNRSLSAGEIASVAANISEGCDNLVAWYPFEQTQQTCTENNLAPVVVALSNISLLDNVTAGTVLQTVSASDGDFGDSLTYALHSDPLGKLGINPSTGAINLSDGLNSSDGGSYVVVVNVTDGSETVQENFSLEVNTTATAPVMQTVRLSPAAPEDNQDVSGFVNATDANGDSLDYTCGFRVNGVLLSSPVLSGRTEGIEQQTASFSASNFVADDVLNFSCSASDGTFTSSTLSVQVTIDEAGESGAGGGDQGGGGGGGGGGSGYESNVTGVGGVDVIQPSSQEIRQPFCPVEGVAPPIPITLFNPHPTNTTYQLEVSGLSCDPVESVFVGGKETATFELTGCGCPSSVGVTSTGDLLITDPRDEAAFARVPISLTGSQFSGFSLAVVFFAAAIVVFGLIGLLVTWFKKK